MNLKLQIYRTVFWTGYLAVLIMTIIPLKGVSLNKITIGPDVFRIRLDFLLHFIVYFLICLYYLAGWKNGFTLFTENSLIKFFLLVLFLAIVTELVQLWVPDRAFNIFDLASNIGGVIAGLVIVRLAQRRRGA
jgi:VanZ family protein